MTPPHLRRALFLSVSALLAPLSQAQVQVAERIVGGIRPQEGYPWMVAQIVKGSNAMEGQTCGGALIDPKWVLTAAHCVPEDGPESIYLVLKARDLRAPEVIVPVKRIVTAPGFTRDSHGILFNDLALYELDYETGEDQTPEDRRLEQEIAQIPVVPLVDFGGRQAPGAMSRVLGFGYTRTGSNPAKLLRQVDLPIVSTKDADVPYQGLDVTHVAAGYKGGGVDSCQGDSGGPLLVNGPDGWMLGSVVSFGPEGCGVPGIYGIYASVNPHKDWIIETITEKPSNAPANWRPPYIDDHSNGLTLATQIYSGWKNTGRGHHLYAERTVTENGVTKTVYDRTFTDLDYFKITLSRPGRLHLKAEGPSDTSFTLYDSRGVRVATRDDVFDEDGKIKDLNFDIRVKSLNKGVYYIAIEALPPYKKDKSPVANPETFEALYSFTATEELDPPSPDILVIDVARPVAKGSIASFGPVPLGGEAIKTFIIGNKGRSTLELQPATIDTPWPFKVITQPAMKIAPGKSTLMKIAMRPVSTSLVSGKLFMAHNDTDVDDRPGFTLNLTGTVILPERDDFGDTMGTAKVVAVPSSTKGVLFQNDVDVFKFTIASTSAVVVHTQGVTNTRGVLTTAGGEFLAENDDATAVTSNFVISTTLNPGTYCVVVDHHPPGGGESPPPAGAYTLVIDARRTR